jgi:hypothetical protein
MKLLKHEKIAIALLNFPSPIRREKKNVSVLLKRKITLHRFPSTQGPNMSALLPGRTLLVSAAQRNGASSRRTTQVAVRKTQVRSYSEAFNFGKMVEEKSAKAEGEKKKSIEESYWNTASEDEKRRREGLSNARVRRAAESAVPKTGQKEAKSETPQPAAEAAEPADSAAEAVTAESTEAAEGTAEGQTAAAADSGPPPADLAPRPKMSATDMEFWQFAERERDEYENETAEANDPCFSVRAQQAAWQLHKSNPGMHTLYPICGPPMDLRRPKCCGQFFTFWFWISFFSSPSFHAVKFAFH